MKKILAILAALVLLPVLSWASPFFATDPQTNGTHFEIELDGTIYQAGSTGVAGINLAIYHDIAPMGLIDGAHQARARTCNLWGCDPWTPFLNFDKRLPGVSLNFTLVP